MKNWKIGMIVRTAAAVTLLFGLIGLPFGFAVADEQNTDDYSQIIACPSDANPANCDRSADGWWMCAADDDIAQPLESIELEAYSPAKAYLSTILACTYLSGIVTTKEVELIDNVCVVDEAIGAFRCQHDSKPFKAVAGPIFAKRDDAKVSLDDLRANAEAWLSETDLRVSEVQLICDCDTTPCACDEPHFAAAASYLDFLGAQKLCNRLKGDGLRCEIQVPER